MGGKNKPAQRTKNNARPSSSGRSAELLGSTIPPFVGFSGVKDGSYVPLLPGLSLASALQEDVEGVEGNFQIVLKKMSKKDATTKLKALQEFTTMISNSNIEAVKAVLPFWPRLYCHLATDTEHRVREAAQLAQGAVALKVKRNLAPYLKQLAPAWLTAQYDTYAPAATSAMQSFQQAFPSNKLPEVMLFCQEEVLSYICDNLTVHTAQTLSNPKTTTPENAEAKYERVLICSLHGYSFYLKTIPTAQLQNPHDINNKIVTSSRFWKLAKHKTPSVRSAWYKVLSSLCTYCPILLEAEGAHLTCAVMANLDENEPSVLPAVWEAALLALSTVKEWWTHVSVEKVVLPILWRVLKGGGQGCASSIFPHLLPLLAHFPPGQDPVLFYTNYFDNMRQGLANKTVLSSRSELTAVSIAIIECMKYTILKNQSNSELCAAIISKQLIPIIEWSLLESQSTSKIIFKQISSLIHYWSRNADKPEYPLYMRLVEIFWKDLNSLCRKVFDNLDAQYDPIIVDRTCESLLELMTSLKSDKVFKTRTKLKVTFTASENEYSNSDNVTVNSPYDTRLGQQLNVLVCDVARSLIDKINKVQTKQYTAHLCQLIQEFESAEMFKALILNNVNNSVLEFYREILLNWLNIEAICTKELISLCFALFKYLDQDEKLFFLCSLTQVSSSSVMSWSVSCCLSHPLCEDPTVQDWLKKHDVSALLINITNKIITNNELSDNIHILKKCFMHNEDVLISEKTSADVINLICNSLESESETLDTCASFASQISTILYSDSCGFECDNTLVQGLFSLALRFKGNNEYFSTDTLWEVNSAWQDAVGYITKDRTTLMNLAKDCAVILQTYLCSRDVIDKTFIETASDSVISFIKTSIENSDDDEIALIHEIIEVFLNISKTDVETCHDILSSLCLQADLVTGKFSVFSETEAEDIEKYLNNSAASANDIDQNLLKYLTCLYLRLRVITKVFEENTTSEIDEEYVEDDKSETGQNTSLLKTGNSFIQDNILELVYGAALLQSFITNYKDIFPVSGVSNLDFDKCFISDLVKLFSTLDSETTLAIESRLSQAARTRAIYWTSAVYLYGNCLKIGADKQHFDVEKEYKKVLTKENLDITDIGWVHMTQTYKNLPAECISVKYDGENDPWIKFRWSQTVAARCMLESELSDETDTRPCEIMHVLLNRNILDSNTLLYNRVISTSPWSSIMLVSELARLMALIVTKNHKSLSDEQWDGLRLALGSWVLSAAKSKEFTSCLKMKIFVSSIFELFGAVSCTMKLPIPEYDHLQQEWNDVFAKEIHLVLLKSWMDIADSIQKQNGNFVEYIPFIHKINKNLVHVDMEYVFRLNRIDSKTSVNDLIQLCLKLLQSKFVDLQFAAQHMLKSMAYNLVHKDDEVLNNSPEESNNPLIFDKFEQTIKSLEDLVRTLLLEFKLCEDSCAVKPNTDSFYITLGYLLLCDVILHYCSMASSSLRLQYASWLSSRDFIKLVLENVFRLMPHQILYCTDLKIQGIQALFSSPFKDGVCTEEASDILEHLACYVYCNTLRLLPALARQWWNSSESRVSNIVEKLTTTYVSPLICKEEIEAVQNHQTKDEHMQVKVNAAYEVLAIYTVDDVNMEILISLPYNYPLGPVKVMSRKEICSTAQWRTWVRQLTLFLTHQNGNIWDGLSLWKSNLDRRFDGVEECYVCYSVVHASTHQLPKLTCKTCRKKFHSQCLYKWFNTSNKSTCPICRNIF